MEGYSTLFELSKKTQTRSARNPQCHTLDYSHRAPVAQFGQEFSPLGIGVLLLCSMGPKTAPGVDVLGRPWKVEVHAAHQYDSPRGVDLLDDVPEELPRLQKIMGDKSHGGTFAQAVEKPGLTFEIPLQKRSQRTRQCFQWLNV